MTKGLCLSEYKIQIANEKANVNANANLNANRK
jgi:hypothetical protein